MKREQNIYFTKTEISDGGVTISLYIFPLNKKDRNFFPIIGES